MKTKTSFKRAALPVVATLLTAIISLTGVTYAWFTAGTTATVDQITVGVEEADGLQIATGTTGDFTWGSQYTVASNLQNLTFSPISGAISSDNVLTLYKATLDDNYDKITTFTTEGVTENSNYISFDLYFRNVSTSAKTININGTEVTASTGDSHRAARIAFLKMASVTGSAASYKLDDFSGNPLVKDDTRGQAIIYEPNSTSHSVSGIADYEKYKGDVAENLKYDYMAIVGTGESGAYYNRYTGDYFVKKTDERKEGTYVAPTQTSDATISGGNLDATGKYYLASTAINGETFAEWNASVDYVAVGKEIAIAQISSTAIYTKNDDGAFILVKNGSDITSASDDTAFYICKPVEVFEKEAYDAQETKAMSKVTTQGDADTDTYFTLAPNTVTKVTVVIWLEGQDADCNNSTAGRPFTVALKFNGKTVTSSN